MMKKAMTLAASLCLMLSLLLAGCSDKPAESGGSSNNSGTSGTEPSSNTEPDPLEGYKLLEKADPWQGITDAESIFDFEAIIGKGIGFNDNKNTPEIWYDYTEGTTETDFGKIYSISPTEGKDGTACAKYETTDEAYKNNHADIIFNVEKNTDYVMKAEVKTQGTNMQGFLICDMAWNKLSFTTTLPSEEWSKTYATFNSGNAEQVRICWYAGSNGTMYQSGKNVAWLDNLRVEKATEANTPKASTSLEQGDFENAQLMAKADTIGVWGVYNDTTPDSMTDSLAAGEGVDGSTALKYFLETAPASPLNSGVRQQLAVTKKTEYMIVVQVKTDGKVKPIVNVTTSDWTELEGVQCEAVTEWTTVYLPFNSSLNELVRLQIFGGIQGEEPYENMDGTAWFDNFQIYVKE